MLHSFLVRNSGRFTWENKGHSIRKSIASHPYSLSAMIRVSKQSYGAPVFGIFNMSAMIRVSKQSYGAPVFGIFNMCDCTRAGTDTVRESALNIAPGKKPASTPLVPSHNLFMCRVSMDGICRVWPCLTVYYRAVSHLLARLF